MTASFPPWMRVLAFALALFSGLAAGAAERTPPPSDEACEEFGRRLAACIAESRGGDAMAMFDKADFGQRVASGLGLSPKDAHEFVADLPSTFTPALQYTFTTFDSARFLRIQKVGDDRRVLVRLLTAEGTVHYMSFVCVQHDAEVRWSDLFVYLTGELLSSKVGRHVTAGQEDEVRSFTTVAAAKASIGKSDFATAHEHLEKLPPRVKQDRLVLMLRLRAARELDEEKHLAVIEQWEKAFPNDPTLALISIDGDLMRKNYASALRNIDSLAQRLGGDPYLHFLAATVHLAQEQYDRARQRARAALESEPDLILAYNVLIAVGLKTKNYSDLVSVLDELKKHLPVAVIQTLFQGDDVKDFCESAAYRNWAKRNNAEADAVEASPARK